MQQRRFDPAGSRSRPPPEGNVGLGADMSELKHYRRLWIFVTVVTVLLIGITVTLNVMHAPPTWGARLIGGTPPVFVFFCIELVSRIPATSKAVTFGRIAGSVVVAGFSFAISYQQQVEFIHALGFVGWVANIYPIIIDGVMVVATLSLVEVTRKVRALRSELEKAPSMITKRIPDPTFHLEDERTRAYREEVARMRNQSGLSGLNGKPVLEQATA
jgi:hypothetical protein